MINKKNAKSYCSEDISLIENYQAAISDEESTWEIHHRRECDENGRTLLTGKQLIKMDLYKNRPASELIFVTKQMHMKIHREMRSKAGKIVGKKYGAINGTIVGKKYGAINGKKRSIPILQFAKDGTFIKEWQSAGEAQSKLGIWQPHICDCCKGKRKTAGGFVWMYKDSK